MTKALPLAESQPRGRRLVQRIARRVLAGCTDFGEASEVLDNDLLYPFADNDFAFELNPPTSAKDVAIGHICR